MVSAKDIVVRPIAGAIARAFVRKNHYSGKVSTTSTLHMGVFLGGALLGAMQFGRPMDRSKLIGLVSGTAWNSMLELNRMVFMEELPRNSESRALGVAFRMLRKHRPDIEWIVSFADGTQCGDGAIYRAAGFVLTDVRESNNLARFPWGVAHKISYQNNPTRRRKELGGRTYMEITGGQQSWGVFVERTGGEILPGHQLRYVYFLNPAARERLTVPILPFSAIDAAGARMYRGVRAGPGGASAVQVDDGGSTPTTALHSTDGE